MALFCKDDSKADVIKLLKTHCKSRPFRQTEGVVGSHSTTESEDTKIRFTASEEEIRGVRDFVRKVNLTSNEYQVSWVCDGDLQNCMLCSEGFTMFRRKHHCRGCGYIICWNCFADSKIKIKALKKHESSSIACYKCFDQLTNPKAASRPPSVSAPSSSAKSAAVPVAVPVSATVTKQEPAAASSLGRSFPPAAAPPPSTVKKPITAVIMTDASGLGTPETRQAILQGAIQSIVWEADDGLSTPGSTAHISPTPIGHTTAISVKQTPTACFWDDSSADTPEPCTPAVSMPSAASERYFYTPTPSVSGTPGPAFTPLLNSAQLTTHNLTLSSKAIVMAAQTGVWQPPPESPVSASAPVFASDAGPPQPSTIRKRERASIHQQTTQGQGTGRSGAQNVQNVALPLPPANSSTYYTKPGDDQSGTLFYPIAGFSLKVTRSEDPNSTTGGSMNIVAPITLPVRMFVNVCHHSSLPAHTEDGAVYTLVGPQHQAIDESGTLFAGFDVTVASALITSAFQDEAGDALRVLCVAVLSAISAKQGVHFNRDFKLARTGAGYIGKAPLSMRVPAITLASELASEEI